MQNDNGKNESFADVLMRGTISSSHSSSSTTSTSSTFVPPNPKERANHKMRRGQNGKRPKGKAQASRLPKNRLEQVVDVVRELEAQVQGMKDAKAEILKSDAETAPEPEGPKGPEALQMDDIADFVNKQGHKHLRITSVPSIAILMLIALILLVGAVLIFLSVPLTQFLNGTGTFNIIVSAAGLAGAAICLHWALLEVNGHTVRPEMRFYKSAETEAPGGDQRRIAGLQEDLRYKAQLRIARVDRITCKTLFSIPIPTLLLPWGDGVDDLMDKDMWTYVRVGYHFKRRSCWIVYDRELLVALMDRRERNQSLQNFSVLIDKYARSLNFIGVPRGYVGEERSVVEDTKLVALMLWERDRRRLFPCLGEQTAPPQ